VCVNKFYDANVNGYPDYGEEPMGGVAFSLTGNGITQTQTTGSDGKAAFSNIPDGIYVVKENVPSGYYSSLIDSQYVYVFSSNATVNFGNVCIGAGGAKGMGFWTSKNGEGALNNSGKLEDALWWLRYWGLRNADGTDFDPYTYAQLRTWMMGANSKNMTFVQPHPCTGAVTKSESKRLPEVNSIGVEAKVWPNPSNNYFTLRAAYNRNNEGVLIKVYNANGQQVYTANGSSNKDYRFGD